MTTKPSDDRCVTLPNGECVSEGPCMHSPQVCEIGKVLKLDDKMKTIDLERRDLPYPWCRQPEVCKDLGSCPRDPSCGD